MCFFWCIKTTYLDMLTVEHYLRAPFSLMERYASKTRCIIAVWVSYVVHILRSAYVAQIIKSVVNFVAVYMIDVMIRPFTSHIKPSQSMRAISPAFNGYAPVSRFHLIPGNKPCVFTGKNACIGIVSKFFFENLNRQHVASFTAEVLP